MKKLLTTFFTLGLFGTFSCAQDIPTVSVDEVKSSIDGKKDIVLLDVRKPEEVNQGVISSDIVTYNFFDEDFKDQIANLDKDQTYHVYCAVGGRSGKTVKMMQEMGFKNVYNVEGGIKQWKASGNQLVQKP